MTTKLKEELPNYSRTFEQFGDMDGLGFSEGDIEAHLMNTAQCNVQDIIDVYSERYRKTHGLNTLPKDIWQPLQRFARLKCADHCEKVARALRSNSQP
jgi:hypothetical protein